VAPIPGWDTTQIEDKVSRRPGVETDITTRAIYNESTCTLSGQLRFLSPFPLDAESGSPDTWTVLLGKRPSSVRRSMLHLTHWTRKESLFLKVAQRTETGVRVENGAHLRALCPRDILSMPIFNQPVLVKLIVFVRFSLWIMWETSFCTIVWSVHSIFIEIEKNIAKNIKTCLEAIGTTPGYTFQSKQNSPSFGRDVTRLASAYSR